MLKREDQKAANFNIWSEWRTENLNNIYLILMFLLDKQEKIKQDCPYAVSFCKSMDRTNFFPLARLLIKDG